MMEDKDFSLAEKILQRLNEKGAGLGNMSVLIIQAVLEENAAEQNMHLTSGSLRYLQETLTPRQFSALKDLFTPPTGR